MRIIKIERGGIWESREWSLVKDQPLDPKYHEYCPHVRSLGPNELGVTPDVVPWVVMATNEGGYNSTGVCAECIAEAMANANKEEPHGRVPQ